MNRRSKQKKMKIYPSVMGKTQQKIDKLFARLADVSRTLHLDVADGKFVPNTSLWFAFRLSRKFTYNVHLMIQKPLKWIQRLSHKVDLIIFHPEPLSLIENKEIINLLKQRKKKVGIALKPETKVKAVQSLLPMVDYVLILTVNPGFYGARYLKSPLRKIAEIKQINPKVKVIVDGHMNPATARDAQQAGADAIVSGSFIAQADDPKKALHDLREALQ